MRIFEIYIIIALFICANLFSQNDTIVVSASNKYYTKIKKEGTYLEYFIEKRKVKLIAFPGVPANLNLYLIQDSLRNEIKKNFIFKIINTKTKEYIIATTCSEEFDMFRNYSSKRILLASGFYKCSCLKTGKWYYYYYNGNIKAEGTYTLGKKTEKWKYFNKHGQLEKEIDYKGK